MENRKGSGIFLGVISVATLIVAIIGATFAFFSATANSAEGAVATGSQLVQLGYKDNVTGLKTNLIPATETIALYAATDPEWVAGNVTVEETGQKNKGRCFDDRGNEICSVYTFTVGNPNFNTLLELSDGQIVVTTNDFSNLVYVIYDETGAKVVNKTTMPISGTSANLGLGVQQLKGSSLDSGKTEADGFIAKDPSTYTAVDANGALIENYDTAKRIAANKRSYTMVIWVDETGSDQTEADSGKVFAASVTFETGGAGVTGVIASAGTGA